MKLKVIKIEWIDSTAHFDWCPPSVVKEIILTPLSSNFSVGFLLHHDGNHFSLAQSIGTGNIHNIINIPTVAVCGWQVLGTQEIDYETFKPGIGDTEIGEFGIVYSISTTGSKDSPST